MKELEKITPLEENFAQWYQDVIKQGQLIHYGKTKGSMIFKPIAYGIWENVQLELNKIFKKNHIQNVYLPLLIPKSFIEKEKNHIKGFKPELATITKVGNKDLEEHYVIRPTSEVLFGDFFSNIVRSHKDLPIFYNQWANIVRWEKTVNPFLRNREFLWQEGHTVHSSALEARKFTRKMIKIYAKFFKNYLAIPVLIGKKTSREKFSGAISTYTIEAMMKDGKALQSATSHYLGQNFAKSFNIKFTNKNNKKEYSYQTSWGVSTRLIGALIMSHSDNRGIVIPPKIAPNQIDILTLFDKKNPKVGKKSEEIFKKLSRNYRVRIDNSEKQIGFKASNSEIQGTPLRIEIGPQELKENKLTIVRRDTLQKRKIDVLNLKKEVKKTLDNIQKKLYDNAKKILYNSMVETNNYKDFKKLINDKKFVLIPFAGNSKDEKKIQDETGATARCIPFDFKTKKYRRCFITNKKTKRLVIFAKAY